MISLSILYVLRLLNRFPRFYDSIATSCDSDEFTDNHVKKVFQYMTPQNQKKSGINEAIF